MNDRIVAADSTSCLDFIPVEHNIEILPLYLHMQGEKLRDVIDISAEEFIHWMIAHPQELPYSSPPSMEDIDKLYTSWIERGIKEAILVTLSSAISDTYRYAVLAAEKYRHLIRIEVFDSRTTLYGQAMLALEAENQMRKNFPLNAVIAHLEYMRENSRVYFTVGKLGYLIKNGRLSMTKALFAQILKIRPVMYFNSEGVITPVAKVRGLESAQDHSISHISRFIENRKAQIYVMRSLDRTGSTFESKVRQLFPDKQVISLPPSPVIACHTGPELYGFGAYVNY